MPIRQLVPVVMVVFSACVDAQTPTDGLEVAGAPVEVADGRGIDVYAEEDLTAWADRPGVRAAIEGARAHWTAKEPGYEEEVRVLGVAHGAFTRPGVSEHAVLYLMGLWPRCCPKIGLAILEEDPASGGGLVRNAAFEGSTQTIRTVPDLDGDGLDELALIGEFGMGGYTSQSAALVAFGPDGLEGRGAFGTYEGGCAAGQDDETASRILARPGSAPTFTIETYVRSGCEDGLWTLMSGPEPVSVEPPAEDPYVDLPVE